jgi:hypothetical protein
MDTVMENSPSPARASPRLAAMENESRFAAAVHNAQAAELRVAAAGLRDLRAQLRARIGVHNAQVHEQAQRQAQLRARVVVRIARAKAKAKAKGGGKSKTKSTAPPPGVSRK